MTELENLLGRVLGGKRSQPAHLVGESSVRWLALTEDGDRIELRNIKEARTVAKSGYVEDEKISLIVREQGSTQDSEYDVPGDIPRMRSVKRRVR